MKTVTWADLSPHERHELEYLAGIERGVIPVGIRKDLAKMGLITKQGNIYSVITDAGRALIPGNAPDNQYTDAAQHTHPDRAEATLVQDERFMAMRQLAQAERRIAELEEELWVTDMLLEARQSVLDAIPPCPEHGACVPHALEWIEKAKLAIGALRLDAD